VQTAPECDDTVRHQQPTPQLFRQLRKHIVVIGGRTDERLLR